MNMLTLELTKLDKQVCHALETGDQTNLKVLGYGEISLVVALQTEEGRFACKRLPRFATQTDFEDYLLVFNDYLEALRDAGITPLPSTLITVEADHGVIAYCVQKALDPVSLGPNLLQNHENSDILNEIIEVTVNAISPRLGLDAQISNWAKVDGCLVYLDVTTPLLRDENGKERVNLDLFLASLPWLLRGTVKHFLLDEILNHYYTPRTALLDLIANLLKERLDFHISGALTTANHHTHTKITERQIRSYYVSDARIWAILQRLRRVDRFWQRHIRRRVYPFLLPGDIDR